MIVRTTLVFVFATPMEADPFVAMVNAKQTAKEPWPIYQARIADQPSIIIVTGMGMESARTGVEFIIDNYAVNTIFNCGVAGSLKDDFVVGDIVNVSLAWIYQDGRIHEDACRLFTHPYSLEGYADGVLLTVDQPVFDQYQKQSLSNVAQLVDMEGGMVARLCEQHSISCQLIKIISDSAIERNQLKINLCNVSEKLADRIATDITCLFSQEMTA